MNYNDKKTNEKKKRDEINKRVIQQNELRAKNAKNQSLRASESDVKPAVLWLNVDYIVEGGVSVLTQAYLEKMGYEQAENGQYKVKGTKND